MKAKIATLLLCTSMLSVPVYAQSDEQKEALNELIVAVEEGDIAKSW